jgi:pilus assembly protein CpaE
MAMSETPVVVAHSRSAAPIAQIFVRDSESESIVRNALASLGIGSAEFVAGNIRDAIETLTQEASPKLLMIDIEGVEDPVTALNDLANVCEPNTAVVVIGDRNDIRLYRALRNAGVIEYFFKPLASDPVTRTLSAALSGETESPTSRTGKLVFVLGVRGGVGATTVAVNTAWYLAETRQRWVALLDLDLQQGDAALQLDVAPSHALREAFEHPERVDRLFLERAAIHVDHRIDILASLEPFGQTIEIDQTAVLSLLDKLLARYRFVFVDLPPAVANTLLSALRLPSTCVLVSDSTLVSARDVARWRETIGPNTPQHNTLHLLNQNGAPGGLPAAEFNRAAGQPPDIVVPYDRAIASSATLGVKGGREHAAIKRGLAPLLRMLAGEQAKTSPTFLSRLFG